MDLGGEESVLSRRFFPSLILTLPLKKIDVAVTMRLGVIPDLDTPQPLLFFPTPTPLTLRLELGLEPCGTFRQGG